MICLCWSSPFFGLGLEDDGHVSTFWTLLYDNHKASERDSHYNWNSPRTKWRSKGVYRPYTILVLSPGIWDMALSFLAGVVPEDWNKTFRAVMGLRLAVLKRLL